MLSDLVLWIQASLQAALGNYLYPFSLLIISVLVSIAEALWPWRKEQRQFARWTFLSDLVHLVFNGHFLGVIVYTIFVNDLQPALDGWLRAQGLYDTLYVGVAGSWPIWLQIVVALLVIDFMQWGVHNLLHRVPFLWKFHQTHHSVVDNEMSWIVAFRFQWTEVIVYKALQYAPLAFFGFGHEAVMTHAIFGTLIGHLNHSNLNLDYGPARYILNNPKMHIWHHDYDSKEAKNFGIIFSTWDWIFGTAHVPDHPPRQLGFEGVEDFPRDFFGQSVWPLQMFISSPIAARIVGAIAGLGVTLGALYWAGVL